MLVRFIYKDRETLLNCRRVEANVDCLVFYQTVLDERICVPMNKRDINRYLDLLYTENKIDLRKFNAYKL